MQTPYLRTVRDRQVYLTLNTHDKADMVAMIRTIPEELKRPAALTAIDEERIQYHGMTPGVSRFISSPNSASEPVFSHMFVNIEMLRDIGVLPLMEEIRQMLLRKGSDGQSAWESEIGALRGASSNKKRGGHYTVGATQESGHHQLQPAAATVRNPEYAAQNAHLNRLIGETAGRICQSFLPERTRERLIRRYHADVSIGLGHEDNMFVSTAQVNITPHDAGLDALGDFSGLHVDHDDDGTRYTVLLVLSHLPPEYWPGRFLLTALREYCELRPFTALIFKGVQPHKGLEPAIFSPPPTAVDVSFPLDPTLYVYSRVNIVAYPKKYMTREAPTRLKVDGEGIPLQYKGLSAFGTRRNLHEFFARRDMWLKVKSSASVMDPSTIIPTAEELARCHRWREDGVEQIPRVERIEAVRHWLQEDDAADWADYQLECNASLALLRFPNNSKTTPIFWGNDWRRALPAEKTNPAPTTTIEDDDDNLTIELETSVDEASASAPSGCGAPPPANRGKAPSSRSKPAHALENEVTEIVDLARLGHFVAIAKQCPTPTLIWDNTKIRQSWETLLTSYMSGDLMGSFAAISELAVFNQSNLTGLTYLAASYLQWQLNMSAFALTEPGSKTMQSFLTARDVGSAENAWLRDRARTFARHTLTCPDPCHTETFERDPSFPHPLEPRKFTMSCRSKPEESKIVAALMRNLFVAPYAQRYLIKNARMDKGSAGGSSDQLYGWKILSAMVKLLRRLKRELDGHSFLILPGFYKFTTTFRGKRGSMDCAEEDAIVAGITRHLQDKVVFDQMVGLHAYIMHNFLPVVDCTPCYRIPTSTLPEPTAVKPVNTTPKEIYALVLEICRSAAVSIRLSRPIDDTERMRGFHYLFTMRGQEVLQDKLICARQESPSGRALRSSGLERETKPMGDGWIVLANVMCYRVMYFGNARLLLTWRLFYNATEMTEHMLHWEEDRRADQTTRNREGEGQKQTTVRKRNASKGHAGQGQRQSKRVKAGGGHTSPNGETTAIGRGSVYGNYVMKGREEHPDLINHYFAIAKGVWNRITTVELEKPSWRSVRLEIREAQQMSGELLPSLVASDMARLGWVALPTRRDWDILLGPGAKKGLAAMTYGRCDDAGSVNLAAEKISLALGEDLSGEDRDALIYDRIFVEHLLCKVLRMEKDSGLPRVIRMMLSDESQHSNV